MEFQLKHSDAMGRLIPLAVCVCLLLLLLSPADVDAKPARRAIQADGRSESRDESRPLKWMWSRVAFTDEVPDFVPPPPRDEEDTEEVESRDDADFREVEPLFEDQATEPRDPEDGTEQLRQVPAGRDPIIQEDLAALPPQRDYFDPGVNDDPTADYLFQVMPAGLMYRSYLAGEKESRMASVWHHDQNKRTVWENTLGGRIGLLRYGTTGAYRPQGWQLDFEGAALPRVLPGTESTMLEAVDFRAGIQSTWAFDRWHIKAGYYHLSSHLGDEFVIANPMVQRFNYVRDSTVTGVTYEITDDWQTYGEVAYAFGAEDGAKPLECQYGVQYSPLVFGLRGAPFAAINGHTRQEFDYTTSVNAQAGWQWRGTDSQHLWRVGMQYYSGPSLQYSFPGGHDRLLGAGMWFDF